MPRRKQIGSLERVDLADVCRRRRHLLPTLKHLLNRHRLQRFRVATVITQVSLFRQRNFS